MGSDTAPPLFEVQWRSLLAASKTMYIDRELFDGFVAEARGPCRHNAVARGVELSLDRCARSSIEPDSVVERWSAELYLSFTGVAVAGGAIVGKQLLAFRAALTSLNP